MKFTSNVLAALAFLPAISAFAPNAVRNAGIAVTAPGRLMDTGLASAVAEKTASGAAAATKEEDIALTLAIIMAHGKQDNQKSDDSIPMDSAEELAYIAADFKSMDYDDFIDKYLQEASEPTTTEDEIRGLFTRWNDALATGDSSFVANLYSESPVLLPTVSDIPRTDFDSVKDYFDAFLLKKPQGEILEGHITIGDGFASDSGIYEFTMGTTGDKVKARYTYLYVRENDEWKIQHHHSSVMPEEVVAAGQEDITVDEVKGLFSLWNDALATLDPKKVADRYAKKGVLLPTVSDVPRTDYEGIEDYFTNFLKLEPQGEILESNVVKGVNWAQDCGK